MSLWCQSGRILSVVMTDESVAETDVVLLRDMELGDNRPPLSPEDRDVEEDIADAPLPSGCPDD